MAERTIPERFEATLGSSWAAILQEALELSPSTVYRWRMGEFPTYAVALLEFMETTRRLSWPERWLRACARPRD